MHLDIITLFPSMLEPVFNESILKRSQSKGIVEISFHDLRDYATNKYRSVDDYPYGGSSGMVIGIEPVANCIEKLKEKRDYDDIIYTSPDGELFNQPMANELSLKKNLLILCGHYKGIDERIRQYLITREISIGNYVLTGGELAAAVIGDAIIRLIPGVLNDETSALSDSFQNNMVSPPVYTRPIEYKGMKVPDILLSGNHSKITQWQYEQSLKRTKLKRPELLDE